MLNCLTTFSRSLKHPSGTLLPDFNPFFTENLKKKKIGSRIYKLQPFISFKLLSLRKPIMDYFVEHSISYKIYATKLGELFLEMSINQFFRVRTKKKYSFLFTHPSIPYIIYSIFTIRLI